MSSKSSSKQEIKQTVLTNQVPAYAPQLAYSYVNTGPVVYQQPGVQVVGGQQQVIQGGVQYGYTQVAQPTQLMTSGVMVQPQVQYIQQAQPQFQYVQQAPVQVQAIASSQRIVQQQPVVQTTQVVQQPVQTTTVVQQPTTVIQGEAQIATQTTQKVVYLNPITEVIPAVRGELPKAETRVEYYAQDRVETEYEAVTRKVQVPVQKVWTDYYAVETQTDYIPATVVQQVTEFVPYEKTYTVVEYIPQEKTYTTTDYQPVTKNVNQETQYQASCKSFTREIRQEEYKVAEEYVTKYSIRPTQTIATGQSIIGGTSIVGGTQLIGNSQIIQGQPKVVQGGWQQLGGTQVIGGNWQQVAGGQQFYQTQVPVTTTVTTNQVQQQPGFSVNIPQLGVQAELHQQGNVEVKDQQL